MCDCSASRCRLTTLPISHDNHRKCLFDGFRQKCALRAYLLLFQNIKRLREFRRAFLYLLLQHGNLRVLATKTKDGRTGDIGMRNITGQQAAKRLRILPRAAALALFPTMAATPFLVGLTLRARIGTRRIVHAGGVALRFVADAD